MLTRNRPLSVVLPVVGGFLLIPLVAMQLSDQVNWTMADFVVMGTLLLVVSLVVERVLRKVTDTRKRMLWLGASVLIFLLIWAELAVGLFGTPFAGS